MEGRDYLDVPLFQCGGMGEPRAVRFLFARKSSAALSYRGGGRGLCHRSPINGQQTALIAARPISEHVSQPVRLRLDLPRAAQYPLRAKGLPAPGPRSIDPKL